VEKSASLPLPSSSLNYAPSFAFAFFHFHFHFHFHFRCRCICLCRAVAVAFAFVVAVAVAFVVVLAVILSGAKDPDALNQPPLSDPFRPDPQPPCLFPTNISTTAQKNPHVPHIKIPHPVFNSSTHPNPVFFL
jgi:hypothetical protein